MAKKGSNVHSQMEGGFKRPSMTGAAGQYDHGPAPFDHPRSMGNGAVPTKFMETAPGGKMPTPTQTAGAETRAPRPGTKQRAFGKSDT